MSLTLTHTDGRGDRRNKQENKEHGKSTEVIAGQSHDRMSTEGQYPFDFMLNCTELT